MSDDFDKDLARLDQIRASHRSARPTHENPAWMHTHADCGFLLEFIDNLWKEYSRARARADASSCDPAVRAAAEAMKELIDAQHDLDREEKAVLYGNLDRLYLR